MTLPAVLIIQPLSDSRLSRNGYRPGKLSFRVGAGENQRDSKGHPEKMAAGGGERVRVTTQSLCDLPRCCSDRTWAQKCKHRK